MAEPAKDKSRNDVVDAYRALLIGSVLCFHYLIGGRPPHNDADLTHYTHTYSSYWEIGGHGVEVFFVISGLVITMTVLRSHDAMDFAFRRFSRLYPAAIVCSALTFAVTTLWGPPELKHGIKDLFTSMTLIAPYLGGHYIDGAYWSLTTELKFYFLVAVSFFALRERFWAAIVAIILAEVVATWLGLPARLVDGLLNAQYMPYFLIGMALWYASFENKLVPAAWLGAAGLLAFPHALGELKMGGEPSLVTALVVVATIASLVVLVALRVKVPLGPLPYLGRISYSLYLLHQNIGIVIIAFLKTFTHCPDLVAFGAAALASVGLAALMFHFVETPAQVWLRRHYLRQRPQLETARPFLEKA